MSLLNSMLPLHYLETSSYTKGELEAYDRYWDTIRTERTYYADAVPKD
jgi:hypothetical protein